MKSLIELRNIRKIYRRGGSEVRALDGISICIKSGEYCAIVGKSGSGKSTLMNILGCLDAPTEGDYLLDGEDVGGMSDRRLSEIRNKRIGFIFQGFNLLEGMTALENVELPLIYRGMPAAQRRKLAVDALNRVGLSQRINHRPGELSGGQQQRVAIARAIAASPPVILADEPTGNLDSRSGSQIVDILRELAREGHTVVIITHDDSLAADADRRIRISDGHLCDA